MSANKIKLGVVMDPIESINFHKDTSLAMLLEAKIRGYELYYFQQKDLFLKNGAVFGHGSPLTVFPNETKWHSLEQPITMALKSLDVMLMRKDPPVDQTYLYTTYLLEHAAKDGLLVLNRPQSIRDVNEKLFTTYFNEFIPPTLVTSSMSQLRAFWKEHHDIVCKPLNAMGGTSVFRIKADDVNSNAIFEIITEQETAIIMAQRFIPDITQGDKRILMINGKPVKQALARVPQGDDWRGNLVKGAKARVQPLSKRDQDICEAVGPTLKDRGLFFVGLDVIGDYLTEINVTSPTGIRELETATGDRITADFFDAVERELR